MVSFSSEDRKSNGNHQGNIISVSIKKALSYLYYYQSEDGYWRDFLTSSSGLSTDWITAYVLFCLHGLVRKNIYVKKALLRIKSAGEMRLGWGFSSNVPSDCDSTATALLALNLYSENIPNMKKHLDFLLIHQDPKRGGFSTYANDRDLKKYRNNKNENYLGWTSPHICVTAMVLRVLDHLDGKEKEHIVKRAINYLIFNRQEDGYWESYWWRSKYYSTFNIIEALSKEIMSNIFDIKNIFTYILKNQEREGYWKNGYDDRPCLLSTIYALNTLIILNKKVNINISYSIKKAVKWIIAIQNKNGSWDNITPFFQIPPPNIINPFIENNWIKKQYGTGSITKDNNNIFTTATCIYILNKIKKEII